MVTTKQKRSADKTTILWTAPPVDLQPLSKGEVDNWLGELDEALQEADLADFTTALEQRPEIGAFLGSVFSLSSYLRDLVLRNPDRLLAILQNDPDLVFKELVYSTRDSWKEATSEQELMEKLRIAKAHAALSVQHKEKKIPPYSFR